MIIKYHLLSKNEKIHDEKGFMRIRFFEILEIFCNFCKIAMSLSMNKFNLLVTILIKQIRFWINIISNLVI